MTSRILPPLQPGKILAIGRNYAEHARELGNEAPSEPLVFAVMPSAVIGDGDVIEWEADMTAQVDWEGELAVIIGRNGAQGLGSGGAELRLRLHNRQRCLGARPANARQTVDAGEGTRYLLSARSRRRHRR